MLIHLHPTAVADALGSGETAGRSLEAIELLLQMHIEGQHVISMDTSSIHAMGSKREEMSRRAQRAIDHIRQRAYEIQSLRNKLGRHLELGLGDGFDGREHPWRGHKPVIRAPLHHFDRTIRAICAVLIGENLTDIDFYMALARARLAALNMRWLALTFERLPGGGDTTTPLFEHIASEGRIALAIADSDRKYAGGAPGETWRKLMKGHEKRPRFQQTRTLESAREAENVVPMDVYSDAFSALNAKDPRLSTIRELRQLTEAHRAYADLKDGIKLFHAEKDDEAVRDLWAGVARKFGRDRCQHPEIKCKTRDECRCYVLGGFGSKALDQVVTWLQHEGSRHPRELARLFDLSADVPLTALCDDVIAWGCAFPERLA